MIKVWFIAIFLLSTLHARENPFFPTKGENDIPYTSNSVKMAPLLKQASITLPSSARAIKKVTIEYENLDASIDKRSIELDNRVDWHLPIFISQNYSQTKSVKKSKKKQKKRYKKIASIKHVSFYYLNKSLKVITRDKIIRNFLLVKPHRIVLDFKRDTNLKSYTKKNPKSIFSKIRVGNHSGYYRAVVELDGLYRYSMKKVSNGYIIRVR